MMNNIDFLVHVLNPALEEAYHRQWDPEDLACLKEIAAAWEAAIQSMPKHADETLYDFQLRENAEALTREH